MLVALLCIVLGYVAGSVPFGLLVARRRGVDLRREGSGNIGATNVWRVMGWQEASLTLTGDFSKGLLPVLLAQWLSGSATVAGLTGLASIGGHMYPCFAGFRGGKGVATGLGVFLALLPLPTVLAGLTWVLCLGLWRYVSLSSMVAALTMPVWAGIIQAPPFLVALSAAAAALVVWRHRPNIIRLAQGQEPRFTWPSLSSKK
jgi:glycerol-3-phosphate acyltransferase PlsY